MALEITTAGITIVKLFIRFGESLPHASCRPSNENGKRVPSLVHGQANVAAAVGQAYADSVTLLQANKNVSQFTKAMDAAIAAN